MKDLLVVWLLWCWADRMSQSFGFTSLVLVCLSSKVSRSPCVSLSPNTSRMLSYVRSL